MKIFKLNKKDWIIFKKRLAEKAKDFPELKKLFRPKKMWYNSDEVWDKELVKRVNEK